MGFQVMSGHEKIRALCCRYPHLVLTSTRKGFDHKRTNFYTNLELEAMLIDFAATHGKKIVAGIIE